MRKAVIFALVLAMCVSLAACGKKDTDGNEGTNEVTTTGTEEKKPEGGTNLITGYKTGDVTLGQYKNLTYKPLSVEVTDEEIQEKFDQFVSSYKTKVEITDRDDVRDGDIVSIDFKGFRDGVQFEGGTGSKPDLRIGSATTIPGFEDGIKGHKKGESFSVDCTFPEDYQQNPEMAGVAVVFEITVKDIYKYELPEATDAFIAEKTSNKYETVEAYKDYIRSSLRASKEEEAEVEKQYEVVQKLIDGCTYNIDMESEIQRNMQSVKNYNDTAFMSAYGMDAVGYYKTYLGMTEEQYNEMIRAQSEISVRYEYARSAIVEVERFEITEEEINELATSQMKQYAYGSLDDYYAKLKELYGVEGKTVIEEQVKLNKAMELVYETAVPEE